MDLVTMVSLWNKYKDFMRHPINRYTKEELQEMADVALIIPAQAKHLGLRELDQNTYHERYNMYLQHHYHILDSIGSNASRYRT